MSLWKFGDPVDFGEGYRELEDGEIVPKGAETFMGKKWDPVDGAVGAPYKRARKGRARYHFPIRVKGASATKDPKTKDPKTKYHRTMYPAWNDPQVHTDANGHQYINVDVYSVLAAFDPGHEVAHAVKKLLAAGSRDKGSKIQDYREAIISIEAAIYRAEIEGGAG